MWTSLPITHCPSRVCLLLQDLVQSCLRVCLLLQYLFFVKLFDAEGGKHPHLAFSPAASVWGQMGRVAHRGQGFW